jgi:proteasome accessory factor B
MAGNLERQFSLLQMLLEARSPVRLERIREGFAEYRDAKEASFHKMFERDKAALRALGYVLVASDTASGEESTYTIDRDASLVSDPGLTPEEAAALGLAVAGARGEGALGAMKLGIAAGVASPDGWSVAGLAPDPRVGVLADAIQRRKRVRFTYRTPQDGDTARVVEPHYLTARSGWYLVGHDTTRDGSRMFRLGRIIGAIKVEKGEDADFDPVTVRPEGPHAPWEGDPALTADVAATGNAAWFIERRAGGVPRGETEDGRVLLEVPISDIGSFASWLAGFGAEAVALGPPEVRDAVVRHLRSVL